MQCGRPGFDPWVGKILWRRVWLPTPVFLPRKSHGQRNLEGYSAWGCKESDMTEQLALSLFRGEDGEGREIDEGGQEVHIFSYKINESEKNKNFKKQIKGVTGIICMV